MAKLTGAGCCCGCDEGEGNAPMTVAVALVPTLEVRLVADTAGGRVGTCNERVERCQSRKLQHKQQET